MTNSQFAEFLNAQEMCMWTFVKFSHVWITHHCCGGQDTHGKNQQLKKFIEMFIFDKAIILVQIHKIFVIVNVHWYNS